MISGLPTSERLVGGLDFLLQRLKLIFYTLPYLYPLVITTLYLTTNVSNNKNADQGDRIVVCKFVLVGLTINSKKTTVCNSKKKEGYQGLLFIYGRNKEYYDFVYEG